MQSVTAWCRNALGVASSRGAAWGAAAPYLGLSMLRELHGSAHVSMPGVFVPSMGDSITEGTVAAILVKPGASVAMDQTIAQIETDKVTIDVKAAEAGVVQELLVAEGAIVNPGQMVASVSAGGVEEFKSSMLDPRVPGVPLKSAPAAASPSSAATVASSSSHRRVPMISFPPRRTASGERISDMPANQAAAAIAAASSSAPAPSSPLPPAPSAPSAPVQPPSVQTPKPAIMTRMPEKHCMRELTVKEMDLINLGGAV